MTRFAIGKKEPLRSEVEAFISGVNGDDSRLVSGVDGQAALSLALTMIDASQGHNVKEIE